ncbi:MAG TPA: DUF2147 domain-containing protein [Bradyrhizobium sp.]|jgi:uncharacterized protein (DUF2147 family)|nr:DUF2147 domain-containing protein [Bradyrhizobium sp.]
MKRLLAMAIVLLASSAAQAQYQFEYGGRTIRIDPDRGTISIPGVYDNTGKKSKRAKTDTKTDTKTDQDSSRSKPASQDAKADQQAAPAPAPAPADTAAAPPPAPPAPPAPDTATTTQDVPTTTANNAPADTAALPPPPAPPAPAPLPPIQDAAPQRSPAPPPPAVAAVPPPSPAPVQRRDPNSPIGVWLTEEKEGKVRIEQCGVNLCGYSVDAKSNANGEQVLINMKPGKDQKWSGRILDPNTGSTYDSTIAMKGADTLRVQGCAFGGMFCGGQTWSRVN